MVFYGINLTTACNKGEVNENHYKRDLSRGRIQHPQLSEGLRLEGQEFLGSVGRSRRSDRIQQKGS